MPVASLTPSSDTSSPHLFFHHQFVALLQEADNGVIDLKTAADMLAVRQKVRRLLGLCRASFPPNLCFFDF